MDLMILWLNSSPGGLLGYKIIFFYEELVSTNLSVTGVKIVSGEEVKRNL